MTDHSQKVFIVDDDISVRDSLDFLLKSVNLESESFRSGDEFLAAYKAEWEGCILLDIRMPGISGMEVQRQLSEVDCSLPIIFITGHGDISMAVEAMQLGAHDFIQKPFHDQVLLDKIQAALALRRETQDEAEQIRTIQKNYSTLTPRETEVMSAVAKGLANKVIAMDLNLSQRTVEIHRARVMEKMHVRSLAELVKLAVKLEG